MKSFLLFFLMSSLASVIFAESPDVIPNSRVRAATLEFARKLTVAVGIEPVPAPSEATLKNPFTLEAPSTVDTSVAGVTAPHGVVSVAGMPRGKLEAIAPQITPSGTVEIGGSLILLFGKKKLKVGDRLPIIFEGQPYELEISDIQHTSFTLRLSGEEITRPIKSVIKPKL